MNRETRWPMADGRSVEPKPKPRKPIRDRYVFTVFHDLGPYDCVSCGHGRGGIIEAHHLVSRGQGGDDVLGNLVPLCRGCHAAYHGNPYTAFGVRIDAAHVRQALAAYVRSEAGDHARDYLYRKLGVFGAEAFVQRLEAGKASRV